MPKSYRIRTQVGVDKSIKVNLEQDFDHLNILSLKLLQSDIYNRQCSDYGVIVGRVFVNGGFGLPNAKVSVFIPLEDQDANNPVITDLYPYRSLSDVNEDGYRYNLLPKDPSYDGHLATGTFPDRPEVLLDQSYIEVYDKYYKFTVKTNESGDYMIFGVPLGSQTIFLDVDLSDIGCFSLSPQDLIQSGQATETQVDGSKFKTSTNLNELPQVKTSNKIVDIAPLWGDIDVCQIGITRVDFDLTAEANISINPTSVFMGSVVSTTDDDSLRISCKPRNNTGNLCELIAGPGQILSLRQTIFTDELGLPILEEFKLPQDGKVIDGDGSYLVNLPMNLDYIYTNEFGEQAISNDPKVGIPTKAKYRFKFKWENEGGLQSDFLRANYFVPNIKEHGWTTSDYDSDPLKTATFQTLTGTVPALQTTSTVQVTGPGSLINPVLTNVDSFTVSIAPNTNNPPTGLIPYLGDPLTSITGLGVNNTIVLTIVPTDPTLPSSVTYTGVGTTPNPVNFSLPGGAISFVYGPLGNSGIVFDEVTNVSSYSVSIGPSLIGPWTPYFGDPQIITTQTPNDFVLITPIFTDPLQPASVSYKQYNQAYFDLLKSYTFSLDWDDYVDPQAAIDCEDTFYEFHYNKVYTTAMFLDRYKNGVGRAKHLGIKEIDNRTCKSTVNTFPVNDVIRNFDFLFFVFNLLMTILTFPILVLLFVAHFIAWIWPVLKYLLIFLGIYLVYLGVDMAIDLVYYILSLTNFNVGGPIISVSTILQIVKQALAALFYIAAGIAFVAFTIKYLIKIENFPRIGLPMLSYPDCTTCDCQCGNADFSEANNLDSNSVNQGITDAQSQVDDIDLPAGSPTTASTSNSFIAPINQLSTLSYTHPNSIQPDDQSTPYTGPFYNDGCVAGCGNDPGFENPNCAYKSLSFAIGQDEIGNGVLTAAELGYKRSLVGSESLDVGNDSLGVPDKIYLHAPVPFLFSGVRPDNTSYRFFAKPYTETLSQKLNEFNLRQKYFDGVNKVKVTFNKPQNQTTYHEDQVLVVLAKSGTKAQLGLGQIFSFQDGKISQCQKNITGTTFHNGSTFTNVNQFGNGAVTGFSLTSTTITVNYANPSNQNSNFSPSPVYQITHTGDTESYLAYPIDVEYFQVIEGYTYGDFINQSNLALPAALKFPNKYLRHDGIFVYNDECSPFFSTNLDYYTTSNVIEGLPQYSNYEILIIARGVDPHSPPQVNEYDLSIIFGKNYGQGPIVTGEYYLNVPIQGYVNGIKPKSHVIPNNDTAPNLYFEPYNFTLGPTYVVSGVTCNQFSGFTSVLPYYYLCPDDTLVPNITNYSPAPGFPTISLITPTLNTVAAGSPQRGRVLPTIAYIAPSQSTTNYYFAGGSFTASNFSVTPSYNFMTETFNNGTDADKDVYSNNNLPQKYAVYSPAYYRFTLPTIQYSVNQTVGVSQYLVMRSDRLPTSTKTQNGYFGNTGYALHQNDNFTYYQGGATPIPTIGVAPDPSAGQAVYDESEQVQSLTETLTCEGMVPLKCYQGSGTNISVNTTDCEIPSDRMIQGCYCLLNKTYISQYPDDARLFLEWKTRFTVTFAACRGVFAQVFQNNWINGVLYMFSFNKSTTYSLTEPDQPQYRYCRDTIIYNEFNNGFYYRSSPWNGSNFIGVNSPPPNPNWPAIVFTTPGLGYNTKRIQFPTTIMDLGPREKFISQICNDSNFEGYLVDQVKSTSYQDNSDVIQMGFISRLLNSTVRDQMLPISGPGGDSEGKGIIQFFNSTRKADRIDGDFAQALSINSEWKVNPYINENYDDNFLFIGEDLQSEPRPVFGIFFSSSTEEYSYRRKLSYGIDTLSINCGGVYNYYGYPTDQDVPHYRWKITGPTTSIFGTENNNWDTDVTMTGGFFTKGYQDLDFNTDPYFRTGPNPNPGALENYGFITNFDGSGNPLPYYAGANPPVVNGLPDQSILVGAPFFFYFGLNNGKTAVDKFVKLYLNID